MGRTHLEVLRRHPFFSVQAVTGGSPEARRIADEAGCRWFESADALLESRDLDLVVIAVPHWHHLDLSLKALASGLHVVCEKPLTVTATQSDALMRALADSKTVLTVVFQTRFEPLYERAKEILDSGELGAIVRCEMVETFWRSSAYYRSGAWRASWRGEGGGVVINQAAHVLDRYLWLCGVPTSVTGFCDTALHEIEVEDTATAIMRHENGRHGWIHVNTTECPSLSRTVISCDRGRITIQDGAMKVERLRDSIRARTASTSDFFGEIEKELVPEQGHLIESAPELLDRLYENVALAIAGREDLAITAQEAASVVEVGNAIVLSAATGRAVNLPIDRAAYDGFIADKLARSMPSRQAAGDA